jgi:regulator of RNase E activity RraA
MICSYTMNQSSEGPGTLSELDGITETLRLVSTATITTRLMARGLRNAFMRGPGPLHLEGKRMVGPAFTLRYIPAREDVDLLEIFQDYDHPQRKAIELAPVGSVLVIDARGRRSAAAIGNILATRFAVRGGAGVVTDGVIRDREGFDEIALSTFAAGVSPTTNLAIHHAVDFDLPIGCGEVPVYPDDIIVGDADGVVCIPRHLAAEVAEEALAQERTEEFVLSKILAGRPLRGTYPPDEATLEEYRAGR